MAPTFRDPGGFRQLNLTRKMFLKTLTHLSLMTTNVHLPKSTVKCDMLTFPSNLNMEVSNNTFSCKYYYHLT